MLQDQQYLRIPGPTPIPPSVQRAMAQPMIGHRGSETSELLRSITPRLKKVFGTEQDVLLVTGSGTSGLEAAVVNAVKPLDEVLVIVTGAFGARFVDICKAYGIGVHIYNVEWGKAFDPSKVQEQLRNLPKVNAVFATYCETSTGVMNPIDELAAAVNEVSDALIIVDGVSCIGGVETKMDEWGIDILVTGSQKAFMLPAGLTFIAASKRAWDVIETNPNRGFYLDLTKYKTNLAKDTTPFTPALSLLFGLDQALVLMEKESLANVYGRHALMKEMTREAFRALDIPLLTDDEDASDTVTAVLPNDFDPEELRKVVKQEFGLSLAGGQERLKGKIIRIGHMGYCSPADILQTLGMIELGLIKVGKVVELGKGIAAAQRIYLKRGN